MSFAHPVPIVPSGVELVSRATYISRKKRNRETREFNVKRDANLWRNLKSVMKPQRLL